jgi:hypothetical protein
MADSDLRLVSGATFGFSNVWEQQNEAGEWEPVIITGCTARFVMRDERTGEILVKASTGDGITIPDGNTGEVVVSLPPAKTAGLKSAQIGDVSYELRIEFPSGDVYSLVMGFVAIIEGIFDD